MTIHSHPLPSYISKENLGPWHTYLQQVEAVVPLLDKSLWPWLETLRRPKRSLIVDVPIRLDNGEVAHFEGYRIHHNTSRGPGKGGIRYHQDVTLSDVMALAGSRQGNPGARHEHQRPGHGVDDGYLLDGRGGGTVIGVVTGKPLSLGGSLARAAGRDVAALKAPLTAQGRLAGAPGAEAIVADNFWAIPCDFLVPAASRSAITNGCRIFSSFFWSEDEINQRQERIMGEAFEAIWQLVQERKLPLRTAAFVIGCSRVLEARAIRGLYP